MEDENAKLRKELKKLKAELERLREESFQFTRSQLLQKDRYVVNDILSNIMQSVGKHMKKAELEILKNKGDQEIHHSVSACVEALERSAREMRLWIELEPKKAEKGGFTDVTYTDTSGSREQDRSGRAYQIGNNPIPDVLELIK